MRFLLDTHILIWWLAELKKLSREQFGAILESERHGETVAISDTSLLEIATFPKEGRKRTYGASGELFRQIEANPFFRILPITIPVAEDAGALTILRDPSDRAIVATARVHRLTLLTSDQRIINSKLVPVID